PDYDGIIQFTRRSVNGSSKFIPQGKFRFERNCDRSCSDMNFFVICSTPSAIHSRKPPLLPLLKAINAVNECTCLELYGQETKLTENGF
uniref:Uncharacterized protein n=1 Tax=Parascaris equorum TaxID=6256 RepID=A0A914RDT0_PAREQ